MIAEILVEVLKENAAVLRGFAGRSSLATYLAVIARRTAVRMLSHSNANVVRVEPRKPASRPPTGMPSIAAPIVRRSRG